MPRASAQLRICTYTNGLHLPFFALAPHGVSVDRVPDPFNLFTNTAVEDERQMVIRPPVSRPGDHVDLRADMDLLVGLTACPEDITVCNGRNCTPIGVEVRG